MKLIFAHDHVLCNFNNQYYSTGSLSKEVLERYTSVFEEVIVLSRQKKIDAYNENLTLASTKRVRFVEVPDFKSISTLYKLVEAKRIINKQIQNSDSLIARLPSSIGSLAISEAKKYQKPYLVEVVACPWDALWNHSFKGKLLAPFKYFNTKKLVWNAKYSIYVTNNFLQKRYPTKGISLSSSDVELIKFNENTLDNRLQRISDLNKSANLIIGTTAAVNVKYKGQQFVIEALAKLKKQGITNFEYQLVGGGDPSYLKSIADKYGVSNQVKFLGPLPHNEVFKWLGKIDIYSQPSKQEGMPRALIEAMSVGLPAFGANTAGIPELLENNFIFSNTRDNINEICSIIQKMTKEVMISQAKRNFVEARKYDKNTLEIHRQKFLSDFKSSK